jgi:hypothetical protein
MRFRQLFAVAIFCLLAVGALAARQTTHSYAGLTGAERLQLTGGSVALAATYRAQFNVERAALGLDRLALASVR